MHCGISSPNIGIQAHAQAESAHEATEAGQDGVVLSDHMLLWRAGGLPWSNG
jgi:hypothetical protein